MTQLNSAEAIEALVIKQGFLPFFKNKIPGFSIEEHTPSELWFSDEQEGPWEWKGPVICNGNAAYGKLFHGKAGFVSLEWFPDLLNYRRNAYKLQAKNEPDATLNRHTTLYEAVAGHESLLSKEIKKIAGKNGYETSITWLQMGTWLVVADFEYRYDIYLNPYGWGIARYTTPEALYGAARVHPPKNRTPEESKQRLIEHLTKLLPQATDSQILKLIG